MSHVVRRALLVWLTALVALVAAPALANAEISIVNQFVVPQPPVAGETAVVSVDVIVDQAPYIAEIGFGNAGSLDDPKSRVIFDDSSPSTQQVRGEHLFEFRVPPVGTPEDQRLITVRVSDSAGGSRTERFVLKEPVSPPPTPAPAPPTPSPRGTVQQTQCPAVVTFGLIRARSNARGCWQQFLAGDASERRSGLEIPAGATFYETQSGFTLNGLPFPPAPAGAKWVLVEPAEGSRGGQLGIDRSITVDLGRVDLYRGPVRFSLPAPGGSGQLAAIDLPADTLGGLPVSGSASIVFRNDGGNFRTQFTLQVTLPSIFKPFPGDDRGSITGATQISTVDGRGVSFDGGRIEVSNAAIGSVALKSFCFSYMGPGAGRNFSACEPPSLNGAAAVSCEPPSTGQERFDASALVGIPTPQRADIGAYLGIANGRFAYGGAFIDNARIPIVQGVTLERLGLGVCVNPGLVVKIDGGLGFANGLVRGDASLEYRQLSRSSFSIEVAAFMRVVDIPVGNGRLRVFSNGTVDFDLNAQMRLAGGFLIINGGVSGFIQQRPVLFQVDGRIEVCIDIVISQPCIARASVTVSSIGAGGCGDTFFGTFSAFFKWQQPRTGRRSDFGRGCGFQNAVNVRASAFAKRNRQGVPPFSFPVAEGVKQYVAHIAGAGAAPKVRVTSPSGKVIESGTGTAVSDNATFMMLENPDAPETVLFLPHDSAPGDWKVEALPGSTVTGVSFAADEKKPTVVTGTAKKRGKQWELDLKYSLRAGDKVSLDVVGKDYQQTIAANLVGNACPAVKGRIQGRTAQQTRCKKVLFTPKFGYSGKRSVRATVYTRDDVPVETKTITTYQAGAPATPGKVPGVRLVRRGTTVFAVWDRGGEGTERYGSYLKLSDGRRLGHTAPKTCLAWRIDNVAKTTSVSLELSAGRLDLKFGARATVTLKPGAAYAGPANKRSAKIPKACASV